jgi:hypothetical protein
MRLLEIAGSNPVKATNGKNRRSVLAEMLRYEKTLSDRVIVRCKIINEIAPGDAGAISFDLLCFGVGVKQIAS